MKTNGKKVRLFSLLLSVVLIVSGLNASAFAKATGEKAYAPVGSSMLTEDSAGGTINLSKGDLPVSELKNRKLPKEDKSEAVSAKSVENNGHVNRLRAQEESLNQIIFQNRDGTKTMYSFTYPVKYVAEDGTIRDKKTLISGSVDKKELQAEYAYTNTENDVRAYFPKKLSEDSGVLLQSKGFEIEMSPVGSKGNAATKSSAIKTANQIGSLKTTYNDGGEEKDAVLYKNVFGQGVSVRYASQFNGFKEDVILNKYTGANEFVFKIKTNGLRLVKLEDGNLVFADPEDNAVVASLGSLMIYDSSVDVNGSDKYTRASLYEHYYSVSETKENSEYLVTIHVDDEYLKSKSTVYPVYVDPSLTMLDEDSLVITDPSANVSANIQTSYINNKGQIASGYVLMFVGGSNADDVSGYRGLIDFNALDTESATNPLAGKRVLSANLYIRDLFPTVSSMTVGLYRLNRAWSNGSNVWSNFSSTQQCGANQVLYWNKGVEAIGDFSGQSVGHWYYFNVLDYVTDILRNQAYAGLMLKGVDASNEAKKYHTFAGSGYLGNISLRPALVVEYENLDFNIQTNTVSLCASITSQGENAYVTNVNIPETIDVSASQPTYFTFSANANTEYYFKTVGRWEKEVEIWIYNNKGRFVGYSGMIPDLTFKSGYTGTFIIRIVGVKENTSGKFLITRDYTYMSSPVKKGRMIAFYDKSFMERHGSNSKAQETITGYFEYIRDKMKQYFNVELEYAPAQYAAYSTDFKSNAANNNSFRDFCDDARRLKSNESNVYTFVFTGKSLVYTQAPDETEPLITHDPAAVDCTWRDGLIFITRQNSIDEDTNQPIDNTWCIKHSAWHELLHNFGTEDHYCAGGTTDEDTGYTTCNNRYCYLHVIDNNRNNGTTNKLGLPYSVYRFEYSQISDLCVMYSPKNLYSKETVCACCIISVFKGLQTSS